MKFEQDKLKWINKAKEFVIKEDRIEIKAEAKTDFWQRTHYGFRNDNAHGLVQEVEGDFTFVVKTEFDSKERYDQCGVLVYLDSDNWFKASIEYEDKNIARLGSVVTNLGYSDWATTDITSQVKTMWYRLSKRGKDFLIENSFDGREFKQMRIFHLHKVEEKVDMGIYACSPLESAIEAVFTEFELGENKWKGEE